MKASISLILAVASAASACQDIHDTCYAHWCGNDYWKSQCEKTCGVCTEIEDPGPQPPVIATAGGGNDGACADIYSHCASHWCTDSYWNSQCKKTCNSCSSSPITTPTTVAPTTATITPVSTSAPTRPQASPTTRPPTLRPSTASPPRPPVTNGKKYVMYYPAWATYGRDFQVMDIDASKLTHINYAFANIANGECVLGDKYADTEKFFANTDSWNDPAGTLRGNINQLHHLKTQHPHLVNMISIGGWTWSSQFSGLASTQEGRKKFASSCVDYMLTYGFDGIDVDWEFPVSGGAAGMANSPNDRENFTLLMQALRDSLDLAGKQTGAYHELTIATSADPAKVYTSYDVPAISPILDFVNVMTYDFNGAWSSQTGHNAPLYANPQAMTPEFNVKTAVDTFLEAGLPKEKLIVGLGFYGRGWKNVQSNTDGLFAPANGASQGTWEDGVLDYSDLVENYVNKNGFIRYWDGVSKVPYLFNAATGVFISYDDEESMCYKAGYVRDMGLGGGMVWEVTSDYQKALQDLSYDVIVGGADACHF